ncbi:putative disease resistance protein RGA1 [Bienertia sinuspersici]
MASVTVVKGVGSNLVAKALEALSKAVFKEAASWWGARDELTKLENTMRMIQARIRDAERRQEDDSSDFIRDWLWRLKLLLYRADDLFDEMESSMLSEVGILLSKFGPLYYNKKLAKDIKSIRKELENIKVDMSGLNLRVLPAVELQLPINRLMKKKETTSFVNTKNCH